MLREAALFLLLFYTHNCAAIYRIRCELTAGSIAKHIDFVALLLPRFYKAIINIKTST